MFTTPAFDILGLAKLFAGGGRYARWTSRVRQLPEFSDELPSAALAEEMDTPGKGQIKALLLVAGNPVLSTPNGTRLDAAMQALEYCVAVDFYINESTRHANLILPPVTVWERGHFEAAVNAVQVRNVARYSSAAFAKPAQGKEDWEILGALLARVERHRSVLGAIVGPVRHRLTRWANPDRLLGWALRLGPQCDRTSLGALRQSQRTQDLGPLQSALPQGLYTADKKVQAIPPQFVAELKRLLATHGTPVAEGGAQTRHASLVLIGRRPVRTNNSWMHNFTRLVKGPSGCTLLMHPQDAALRHVFHGDTVLLRSRTGSVKVELALTEDIRPGVVSLPHGWGHDKPGTRLRVAQTYAGASINDVTDELLIDRLSGNAAVNGVEVEVLAI
jgi:anaerobic selenocysteine-containing dehydrogenase